MSLCQRLQHLCTSITKPLRRVTVCSLSTSHSPNQTTPKLPKAEFPGKIVLITNPRTEELKYKREILSLVANTTVLGFDTESKPPFYSRDNKTGPPCLVQLANEELCVMWRLRQRKRVPSYVGAKFPPLLYSILTSKDIMKVGHSSKFDAVLLLKHYNINVRSVLDTYDLVNSVDFKLEKKSLRGLAHTLLGLHLDKSLGLSNWEREKLTESQVAYASTDAWISLQTYKSLLSLAEKEGLELLPPVEDTLQSVSKQAEKDKLASLVSSALTARAKRVMDSGGEFANLHALHLPQLSAPNGKVPSLEPGTARWVARLKASLAQLFRFESGATENNQCSSSVPTTAHKSSLTRSKGTKAKVRSTSTKRQATSSARNLKVVNTHNSIDRKSASGKNRNSTSPSKEVTEVLDAPSSSNQAKLLTDTGKEDKDSEKLSVVAIT